MKNLVRKFVFIGLAFAGSSGFGEFVKGSDEIGEYVIGSDGAKHYYLFAVKKSGTYWSFDSVAYSRKNAQEGVKDSNFINGSIFALEKDTAYDMHYNCSPPMRTFVNMQNRFGDFRSNPDCLM